MNQRKKSICFIDDDPHEIRRFRDNLGKDFIIGAGTSISDAMNELESHGQKKPDLFVLDLYYPKDSRPTPKQLQILNRERKEFLKAEAKFRKALADLNQSSDGGLDLVKTIRKKYGHIPYVFFTRKGTLDDAIMVLERGAMKVMKKPDYNDEENESIPLEKSYDIAFESHVDIISGKIKDTIMMSSWWYKNKKTVGAYLTGILSSLIAIALADNFLSYLLLLL